MALEPGQIVDRYIVESELGQGGNAKVYRVRHTQLATLHALKVLTMPSRTVQHRLRTEGRVQAALRHPNIVAVSDIIDIDGSPGLVMEYIQGPPLDSFLKKHELTIAQADELAVGIIDAIREAHSLELVHRDLKPANIMLAITPTGLVPKVTDFGLAKILAGEGQGMSHTQSGVAMGTPAYMAPEQIRDSKKVDKRADIFSLGAVLYEMVTNHRAFGGKDLFQIFTAVTSGQYAQPRQFVSDIPRRMEAAIQGALQVDPDKRFPDCATLLKVWRGETSGGEVARHASSNSDAWGDSLLQEAADLGSGGDISAVGILAHSAPSHSPVEHSLSLDGLLGGPIPPPTTDVATIPNVPPPPLLASGPHSTTLVPGQGGQLTMGGENFGEARQAGLSLYIVGAMLAIGMVVLGVGLGVGGVRHLWSPDDQGEAQPQEDLPEIAPADLPTKELPKEELPERATPTEVNEAPPKEAPTKESPPKENPPKAKAPSTATKGSQDPPPIAPTEPEPEDPEPQPEQPPAASPTTASVVFSGAERVLLQSSTGSLEKPGDVPPGTYKILVFFNATHPTQITEITVAAGDEVRFNCAPAVRNCIRK
ncbi:MAG: protein kinase [Proteobacteria bacterium]|nr:protein kinase [Pseudomonadota bacterium]